MGVLAAADAEEATMAVDDFFADPETQAGAGDALGGEEGLEDAVEGFRGNACTGVGNREHKTALAGGPMRGFAAAEKEAPGVRCHGIKGVAEEIADDLADFSFKTANESCGAIAAVNVNAGVDGASLVNGEDAIEQGRRCDGLWTGGLLVEAECLVGDSGDAA